jgi:TonB family protein
MSSYRSRALRALTLTLAFAVASLAASDAHADLGAASRDYKNGDFAGARAQFLSLAELGEARAQYNLGVMSLRGEGTAKDAGAAAGWFRAASSNGQDGMKPLDLELLEAGLKSREQEAAQAIFARYGQDAIATRVLPATPPYRCAHRYTPPRTKQMSKARYPLGAIVDRQDGVVIMQVTIGIDGLAHDPEVLAAAPLRKFDEAAVDVVLESRFYPATVDGKPVEARYDMKITFFIVEGGALWNVTAVRKLRELADTGDYGAQYFVGLLGLLDQTLKIPEPDARQLILKSAQSGLAEAQYWVGRNLRNESLCTGVDKMRPWYEQSAAKLGTAQIALVQQMLHDPDANAHVDAIAKLIRQATEATDPYSLKHAVALLSVPPYPALADAPAALVAAKKLDGMNADYDPQVLEVLAAAYAANGDFDRAVKRQKTAIEDAKELYWNTGAMQARLAAYEGKRTWSGDLLALPATMGEIPPVTNEARRCTRGAEPCHRTPDSERTPTGSHITR